MIRSALSVLTVVVVSALFIANGLKSTEKMDFSVPDRADTPVQTNHKHLNSSIDSQNQTAALIYRQNQNRFIAEHRQEILSLEQEINMKAYLKPQKR